MDRPLFLLTLLGSILLLFALSPTFAQSSQIRVVPVPTYISVGNESIELSKYFSFSSSRRDTVLEKAFVRYLPLIFGEYVITEEERIHEEVLSVQTKTQKKLKVPKVLRSLLVEVLHVESKFSLDSDERYELTVTNEPVAIIKANTTWGALRGLETFSQLVTFNSSQETFELFVPIVVDDTPRYAHRGLLLDTGRHFVSVQGIKELLTSMSYAKLNVFHWHITDAQSFPVQIFQFPNLWQGSWSEVERYTQRDLYSLWGYARDRGIRIVLELDGPGHAYSWGIGYPSVLPANYSAGNCDATCPPIAGNPCNVPIDPSQELTYQLYDAVIRELSQVIDEPFVHLGGDEVEGGCWSHSSEIAQWMKANNFTTYDDAYYYFVTQVGQIAKRYGQTPIYWEEVFLKNGKKLPSDTVIQVWLNQQTLAKVVSAGYRGILSNDPQWYLDSLDTNWTTLYMNDPAAGIDSSLLHLILGGEVCMWGERVDGSNLMNTVWPKAAAAAERLWSSPDKADLDDAARRLAYFRCLLLRRGIPTGPFHSRSRADPPLPGSCLFQ